MTTAQRRDAIRSHAASNPALTHRQLADIFAASLATIRSALGLPATEPQAARYQAIRSFAEANPGLGPSAIAKACGCQPKTVRVALGRAVHTSPSTPRPRPPPPPPKRCPHLIAHDLRWDFVMRGPYVPGLHGIYQQFARGDALQMALADAPIPPCTDECAQ